MRKAAITMCGLGFLPIAPGTWGSAGAVAVWMAAWLIVDAAGGQFLWLNLATGVGVFFAMIGSVTWGDWAIEHFKSEDPKPFVLDEGAGQWLALMFLPAATWPQMLVVAAVQFFAFRAADIVKPPPARQFERLPGGWGVLLDDVMAGVYANLVGQVVVRVAFSVLQIG